MEEKRRLVLMNATRRLIEAKATDEDIASSLSELGLDAEEAGIIIRDVKNGLYPQEQKISQKAMAMASDSGSWKESLSNRIEEEKAKYVSAKTDANPPEKMPEDEFPKHFISKGMGEQFIPQLRTGRKEMVKEIIVESQIGRARQEKVPVKNPEGGEKIDKKKKTEEPQGTTENGKNPQGNY